LVAGTGRSHDPMIPGRIQDMKEEAY